MQELRCIKCGRAWLPIGFAWKLGLSCECVGDGYAVIDRVRSNRTLTVCPEGCVMPGVEEVAATCRNCGMPIEEDVGGWVHCGELRKYLCKGQSSRWRPPLERARPVGRAVRVRSERVA